MFSLHYRDGAQLDLLHAAAYGQAKAFLTTRPV